MNILVVDDEYYILDGLRVLLQRYFSSHALYFCSAARQATKLIDTVSPDIVVSDINMNEMNGLEFIAMLRREHPETRVIIISGYHDFEYAQRAIQLQVNRYVLKPIDQAQFVSLLQDTIDDVQQEAQRKERAGLNVRDAQKKVLLDLVKYGFQTISMDERLKRLELWSLFGSYCVGVVVFKDFHLLSSMSDTASFTRMNHRLEHIIDACSRQMILQQCVWAECAAGEYLFVTSCERSALKALLCEIQEAVKRELCVPALLGVSDCCNGCHSLFYGYQEARSLALHTQIGTRHESVPDLDLPRMLEEFENNFQQMFRNHSLNEMSHALSFVYDFLFSGYRTNPIAIEGFVYIYRSVCKYLIANFAPSLPELEDPPMPCENIAWMEAFMKKLQCEIKRLERKQNEQRINEICETVRALAQSNYAQVTLQSAAQEVGISYTYLSIIFKEHTGENFKDYITRIRMEMAMRLLATDKKVYEIAQEVGYTDIKYFSRLFKNFSGDTPNNYREKIRAK